MPTPQRPIKKITPLEIGLLNRLNQNANNEAFWNVQTPSDTTNQSKSGQRIVASHLQRVEGMDDIVGEMPSYRNQIDLYPNRFDGATTQSDSLMPLMRGYLAQRFYGKGNNATESPLWSLRSGTQDLENNTAKYSNEQILHARKMLNFILNAQFDENGQIPYEDVSTEFMTSPTNKTGQAFEEQKPYKFMLNKLNLVKDFPIYPQVEKKKNEKEKKKK